MLRKLLAAAITAALFWLAMGGVMVVVKLMDQSPVQTLHAMGARWLFFAIMYALTVLLLWFILAMQVDKNRH